MWKRKAEAATLGATLCAAILTAQKPSTCGNPSATMEDKARLACTGCHDEQIIVQQKLGREAWAKEVEKMIRFGAPVALEDRERLTDYFAGHFHSVESAPTPRTLVESPGVEKVRAACMGCHDEALIVQQRLDRAVWTRSVDKMVRWGAPVPPKDREAILNYLCTNYAEPAQPNPRDE